MSHTFDARSIALASANRVVEAAIVRATSAGLTLTVAVTDPQGALKSYQRMEGASILSTSVAIDKAFTAATSGFDTAPFFDFIKADPALLHGMTHVDRYAIFGGGIQILEEGHVIGAIGVSGAHYTQDDEIARAAIDDVFGASRDHKRSSS